jgi:ribosomal protein S12 methylthiotransferase accessory factor
MSDITLLGTGRLRDAVERRLAPAAGTRLTLAVSDGWDPGWLSSAAHAAADSAFLSVHVELGRAVIGPAVLPGVPGCARCLDTRRAPVDFAAAADRAALLERHGVRLAEPSPWLTAFAGHAVAALAGAEAHALVAGQRPRTRNAVIVVELDRISTTVHPFLPDPHCPECSAPRPDEPAVVRLAARPKPAPAVLRATDVAGRAGELLDRYVDPFAGLVAEVAETDVCGLPVAYARTGWAKLTRTEPGIGRATDRVTSRLAAVLEAVERRAGMTPSARSPLRARFADIAEQALDPRTLGLPPATVMGYRPFDPDRELEWVWGYSFGRAEPILVPRTYAYYGHKLAATHEPPMVYETSNGCALGGCFEEAALHGLLEVAERDAFLLTWYARMPVPRIAISSARSADLRLAAERLERVHGYRVAVFDTSLEHGIPSVAVVAVDQHPSPLRPAAVCAAGAHLDPERACWAALGELALIVAHQVADYPVKRAQAAAMVADADLVREMDHHALLYGHADTVPRWDFLLADRDEEDRAFAESFTGRPAPATDLRDDLVELIGRYRQAGLDVIVVDQTGPEQRAGGLSAAKVIVPGTLPMTFGHRNRRTRGLPRLHTVPVLLGHRTEPLPDKEINPYPHPFP